VGLKPMTIARVAAAAAFVLLVLVPIPLAIAAAHRTDLYYTLSSVALLSIASAGVWLTFYIGRINIGQGAYALIGGYVSAVLVATYGWSFWLSLPIAGLFCALASVVVGLPILRLRGVYFAMVTLVLTEVARLAALALTVTNGAKGITSIPAPGAIGLFGLTLVPAFDTFAERNLAFYMLSTVMMILWRQGRWRCRARANGASRPFTAWSIRVSASCSRRSGRTRSWRPRWGSTFRRYECLPTRFLRFSGESAGRSSSPSP